MVYGFSYQTIGLPAMDVSEREARVIDTSRGIILAVKLCRSPRPRLSRQCFETTDENPVVRSSDRSSLKEVSRTNGSSSIRPTTVSLWMYQTSIVRTAGRSQATAPHHSCFKPHYARTTLLTIAVHGVMVTFNRIQRKSARSG